jgi:IS5 family transposase|tara:strand:- start:60 stop:1478 length:1419 start_codon:yes stop_codon:yes gene_type:complete
MDGIMTPKPQQTDRFELFRSHFDQILNPNHELIGLAKKINWSRFDAAFAECYVEDMGAPGKAIRLMVGLHYLKHMFNESDESVVARWVENPYWQAFCGFTHMQHDCPCHPTAMVKWRKRVGADRLNLLLEETIAMARGQGHVSDHELRQVTVDTTVQEKNITHPTDAKLLYRSIEKLVKFAKARKIKLRQPYLRVGKKAMVKVSRYAHAKQWRRMRRELKFLRVRLGRLIRDIRRKAKTTDSALGALLERAERIMNQQPKDKNKLYSLHEPETRCISKGKARVRYEFGQKVSVATTNRGDWMLACELMEDNPYDGHTLAATIKVVERNTGLSVSNAYVDKGYRGHDYSGQATVHIAGTSRRKLTRTQKARRKRRSAVEPKIGHLKQDHRMGRCFLKGLAGDAINATLAAAGANLRKLLNLEAAAIRRFLYALLEWLHCGRSHALEALGRWPQAVLLRDHHAINPLPLAAPAA